MTDDHLALIERLFPQLRIQTCTPLSGGWTSATYAVNDEWIVQLPVSRYSEERLRAQIALLPELVHEVSALIPMPELTSLEPAAMAYRKLEGVAADRAPDGIWPERLGRFVYDLHMVPPEFVGMRSQDAGAVRSDARISVSRLREIVVPLLDADERTAADAMLEAYLDDDALWSFAACLTHGDLGPEHVLVGPSGDLVGVLDWEETSVGDPAWDLAWWMHGMPPQGERALAAYGGTPDATFRRRARFVFALMPWHEVAYGMEGGDQGYVRSGLEGVRTRLVRTL
jgi:aminoglycoside phosphotransferase (APT) family kinase protein